MKKEPLGSHWEKTGYSRLYQLYRRIEDVSRALEKRRSNGRVATKLYIEELNAIAMALKILDKQTPS
jgi:hypothetical protein